MTRSLLLTLIPVIGIVLLLTACGGGGDDSNANAIATADHPVALAFAPDGRLFFAEKFTGVIRIIGADGKLVGQPFADLDVAEWLGLDWGLTGLAVAPDFDANPNLYAFYTERQPSTDARPIARPVLVRLDAATNVAGTPETIAFFPDTQLDHQGFRTNGAIHFGPDDALYLSMGDYDYGKTEGPNGVPYALDVSQIMGKMLRVDADGQAIADNPFTSDLEADSRVFAYGFARASDFAFHPDTADIFSTDATDSCEELNIVTSGGNYGWPDVGEFPFADCNAGPGTKAAYLLSRPDTEPGQFLSFVGVSGMAFLTGDRYQSLGTGLLICEKVTGLMRILTLGGTDQQEITANEIVVKDCTGSVAVGPDGVIYYTNDTSVLAVEPETDPGN